MKMPPSSTSSRPASIRSAVDLPDPDGPTSTSSSASPMSRSRLSTAAMSVPSYVRVAWSYLTVVIGGSSLDRAHREPADHPLLRGPAGDHDRDARQYGRGGELGQEVAARTDVRRDPDRNGGPRHGVQLDR